jgi:hypothetical protein
MSSQPASPLILREKSLPAEKKKKHITTPRMSEQGIYALTCMEQVACLSRRRTCTDKREQVVMPASIIQEVWRSAKAERSFSGFSRNLFVKQA